MHQECGWRIDRCGCIIGTMSRVCIACSQSPTAMKVDRAIDKQGPSTNVELSLPLTRSQDGSGFQYPRILMYYSCDARDSTLTTVRAGGV